MQATKKKNCNVQLERRVSLDILSVKNLVKLSAREMPGLEVGNGDEDLQWSSSFTVCHGHFGLSETEETKLEKYCFFLDVRISLWYWLRRDLKVDLSKAEWVHFQRFLSMTNSWSEGSESTSEPRIRYGFAFRQLTDNRRCLSSRDKKVVLYATKRVNLIHTEPRNFGWLVISGEDFRSSRKES